MHHFQNGLCQVKIKKKPEMAKTSVSRKFKRCSTCKKEKPLNCFHGSHEKSNISTRCQDCVSASFLQYRYKMSVEEFNRFREEQNNSCAICKVELEIKKGSTFRSKQVAVDHCHKTGNVRGLLCSACNTGLGHFRDDLTLLESAIVYLSTSEQQENKEM